MTIDELGDDALERMDDAEIRGFLGSHSVGVLGLPAEGAPVLRPMSYWYDGADGLYLLYVLGEGSRKQTLTDRADRVRFLVYAAETPFVWRSVLLTGTLEAVPEDRLEAVEESLVEAWRPDVFRRAMEEASIAIYELRIDDRSGIASRGVPPGFETDDGA